MNCKILFMLCLLCCSGMRLQAQQDSIRFSLLTCDPGQELYALFGHTAIRYENFTQPADVVFNYGMFSFSTPGFVMRFVKGETDYHLGVIPYSSFEMEYTLRGSDVYSQELNLTASEKQRLLSLLMVNSRPENRVYRYNYFYDNCTTRARDRIEECIAGRVTYGDSLAGCTFRSIIHEFTRSSPWGELGMDLCLGKDSDREISLRQQQFSPFYMFRYAAQATIVKPDGTVRPLVVSTEKIIEGSRSVQSSSSFPLSPLSAAVLFCLVCVLMAWCQWNRQRVCWGWTAFLILLQGLSGCIIAFLFFFSVHPSVDSNWMLFLLNPLPLVYLPVMIMKGVRQKKDAYHWVNLVYLTLFIAIIPLCGQKINLTVLPLALGLLINSAMYIIVWNKRS